MKDFFNIYIVLVSTSHEIKLINQSSLDPAPIWGPLGFSESESKTFDWPESGAD